MDEHLLISTADSDRIQIAELHDKYVQWCIDNKVDLPAVKENIRKVIHKMFGKQKVKSLMKHGDAAYYYDKMLYVSSDYCETQMDGKVKLPSYMSFKMQGEFVVLYIPTTFVYDKELQEFKIFFNRNTGQYWITFGGIELDTDDLGIGHYSSFDQLFVNSVSRICSAFIICQGKQVSLPQGKHVSKNIYQALIGRLGANNQIENLTNTLFSKNCHRVLPLTCELSNRTCHACVHDINQRIRQLGNTGFLDHETVAGLIKHRKGDVLEEFSEDGETEQDNSIESLTPNILKQKLQDVDGKNSGQEVDIDESKSQSSGSSSSDNHPTGQGCETDDDDSNLDPAQKGGAARKQGVCIISLFSLIPRYILHN